MKHIAILVTHDATLASVDIAKGVFDKVNDFLIIQKKPRLFTVDLVGLTPSVAINGGMCTLRMDKLLPEVRATDLVVIPQLCGAMRDNVLANQEVLPWIVQQYKRGAEVASLCVGSFLLAATGLLNGRKCATHWAAIDEFKNLFPDIQFVADKIITDEHGLYTSGGSFSYLNLLLYLVEKFVGRDMAVFVSKMLAIDIERKSQSPYIIFMGQKTHNDEAVRKAQEYIEKNYHDKITVEALTEQFAVSRRHFERRFKRATSNTIIEYIQRVKVEAVKKGLETSREKVTDLMYQVGYSDTKAFRATFRKYTGLSPVAYRDKYSRVV